MRGFFVLAPTVFVVRQWSDAGLILHSSIVGGPYDQTCWTSDSSRLGPGVAGISDVAASMAATSRRARGNRPVQGYQVEPEFGTQCHPGAACTLRRDGSGVPQKVALKP